jgi:hypothetical protein
MSDNGKTPHAGDWGAVPDAQPVSIRESKVETAEREPQYPIVDFKQALQRYELVSVTDDGVVIMTERVQAADPSEVDFREIGMTSPSPFTGWMREEYNNDLRGTRGLRKYDEMRKSDATIRGSLRLLKTPVLSARWFIEPASDSTRDVNVAKFIWWNLVKGMTTSWPQFLHECLLMLDFGYYCFEKVFKIQDPGKENAGKVIWQKLAPRHSMDIVDWLWDVKGGPAGILVYDPLTQRDVPIPIEKLLVFTFDKEGGDMQGISVLRSAYKAWHFKSNLEKIDAIQKERHGIGVPIIKLPMNFDPKDKILAEDLGRNLRTNERAHVVLPPGWEIMFAKLEGQPVSALDSIKYHDLAMQKNVLAPFMDGGSGAGKDDDRIMFLKSSRYIADIVADVINKYCIEQLVDYNYTRVGYPTLCVRRIGEQADWRTMSFAIRNMVGAGIIRPDDKLEENIRDEMDLPKADPDTIRVVATPQGGPGGAGGKPQLPQQKPAGPPRQQPLPVANTGAANAGQDRSGG